MRAPSRSACSKNSRWRRSLQQVRRAVPAGHTFSLVDLTLFIDTLLNNLIIVLVSVASLAMLAGTIIISNADALVMTERRRELGILYSVVHTCGSVLDGALMENGTVGFARTLLAVVLVVVDVSTVLARCSI
jgi:predicted lysophospholipase L1 biosynthesis ABC-type transport system permease subunit